MPTLLAAGTEESHVRPCQSRGLQGRAPDGRPFCSHLRRWRRRREWRHEGPCRDSWGAHCCFWVVIPHDNVGYSIVYQNSSPNVVYTIAVPAERYSIAALIPTEVVDQIPESSGRLPTPGSSGRRDYLSWKEGSIRLASFLGWEVGNMPVGVLTFLRRATRATITPAECHR